MRRITIPFAIAFAIFAVIAIVVSFIPAPASAKAIAFATQGKVNITFFDEPCTLLPRTTNLPNRVTWREGTTAYEGCYGVRPDIGAIVAYFADGTVALIPASHVQASTKEL
jgi:hypothetical protein